MDTHINSNLNAVCFIDSLTGWVVGNLGVILHTLDGGQNWETQVSNIDLNIQDVFFLDGDQGWASAFNYTTTPYGTVLLKTTDGGQSWLTEVYPEENIFITSIVYLDSLTGWMGGTPHTLVGTIDGGESWTQANIDTSTLAFFPVLNIEFYNGQYGYCSGGIFDIAGVIWRTSDGGDTWYSISTDYAPADEVHGLYMFDSLNVIGSGGDPDFGYGVGMMHTSNGGTSWVYDEIGIQGIAYDIDFINQKEGWAPLGPMGKFVYSLDTGMTWDEVSTPDSLAIFKVVFPDSLHGYAIGNNGSFLKFTPSTTVDIEEVTIRTKDIIVNQNYPNPFNQTTRIKINVSYNSNLNHNARLIVYDINGMELISLIPVRISDVSYEVVFNALNYPNGVYYFRLEDGDIYSKTNRMLLIN